MESLAGQHGLMTDGDWVETKDQDPGGDVTLLFNWLTLEMGDS